MAVNSITSRKNPLIIDTVSLRDKKNRDKTGCFAVEGIKLFTEALDAGLTLRHAFFTEKALGLYPDAAKRAETLYTVTDEVYDKLTEESAPQGVLGVFEKPEPLSDAAFAADAGVKPFVLLDGVQNPANLGAVIRSAYCFGFERVIVSDGCADLYGSKCLRAAMGTLFCVKVYAAGELCDAVDTLAAHGARVYGTALRHDSLRLGHVEFKPSDCFVIGNEGHGADEKTLMHCTDTLFIPMHENAESLNAAGAAAVVMWEMRRGLLR